ncbi:hypothetical protein NNRS527_03156 (plasmid) [Nitrosospira sp. NRS527]|nr:hypothetical protein NNRS527_03156 [Nitrosospira sp. NRS527]
MRLAICGLLSRHRPKASRVLEVGGVLQLDAERGGSSGSDLRRHDDGLAYKNVRFGSRPQVDKPPTYCLLTGSMCCAPRTCSPGHSVTIPFANSYLAASPVPGHAGN